MRILAVGDSYLGVPTFEQGLGRLADRHTLEFLQLDETRRFIPATDAERALREYAGAPEEIVARMAGVEALVVHGAPVTDKVLAASEDLKLVGCARGGPVNVDVEAAAARGIELVTTPGKNAEAVADQALGFMILLARRFPQAQRFLQDGGRLQGTFDGAAFFGHDLGGLTAGLVGYGHVGRGVARRAVAFGMRTLVYDPFVRVDDPYAEQVEELGELLARADIVSLHTRATPETENLVDADFLAAMRPDAYLLNTARESLVDEAALDAALASGRLAGAALDVVREDAGAPHPLLRHDNVVITPHIGGATYETLLRGATMIADAIEVFAAAGVNT
jgi:D-3-phosphoglycerate dehydrogenase